MKNGSMQCPICEQKIESDAYARGYCRLCGMNIDDEKEFCCSKCEAKFKRFKGR